MYGIPKEIHVFLWIPAGGSLLSKGTPLREELMNQRPKPGEIQNLQISSRANKSATSKRESLQFTVSFVVNGIKPSTITIRYCSLPLLQAFLADELRLRVEVTPAGVEGSQNLPGGDPNG
jgi:hypothetical protein